MVAPAGVAVVVVAVVVAVAPPRCSGVTHDCKAGEGAYV